LGDVVSNGLHPPRLWSFIPSVRLRSYKQREATERIILPFSHYLTIPAS
jgi:hypothetical protein